LLSLQKDEVMPWLEAVRAFRQQSPRHQWLENWLLTSDRIEKMADWALEHRQVEIANPLGRRYVFGPTHIRVQVRPRLI
jgi:hypothetical protein